jgi:hypothetical protein
VPVYSIFDSVLRNSAVYRKQPNDSVLTLRFAVDPGCGEERDALVELISVKLQDNIAF